MSVLLGLVAALAWGIHDMLVRFAAPGRPVLPLMGTALAAGLVPVGVLAVTLGRPVSVDAPGALMAIGAGVGFALAGYGLYRAFAIGPVALVAPIIGAYPILTVLIAAFSGRAPTLLQTLAAGAIVGGVGIVALLSPDNEGAGGGRRQAVFWSLAAGLGFAATFALAQMAAQSGLAEAEWPKMAITRAAALTVTILAISMLPDQRSDGPMPWRLLVPMGLLDATAMASVTLAAALPRPEFAAVVASVFGVVTILLARAFLSEAVRPTQWLAILAIFAAIASLGV